MNQWKIRLPYGESKWVPSMTLANDTSGFERFTIVCADASAHCERTRG